MPSASDQHMERSTAQQHAIKPSQSHLREIQYLLYSRAPVCISRDNVTVHPTMAGICSPRDTYNVMSGVGGELGSDQHVSVY